MDHFIELAEEAFVAQGITGKTVKQYKDLSVTSYHFDKKGSNRLSGNYYTISFNKNLFGNEKLFCRISSSISSVLDQLNSATDKALIIGLGNESITADALGSLTVNVLSEANKDGKFMLFKPSVFGLTRIESADIINGIVNVVKPSSIITVDTLCCLNDKNLYSSIQISDAGIIPGGGLGNPRPAITQKTLGLPVISIGIPLISYSQDNLDPNYCITPKEIDIIVKICSKLIAKGITAHILKK